MLLSPSSFYIWGNRGTKKLHSLSKATGSGRNTIGPQAVWAFSCVCIYLESLRIRYAGLGVLWNLDERGQEGRRHLQSSPWTCARCSVHPLISLSQQPHDVWNNAPILQVSKASLPEVREVTPPEPGTAGLHASPCLSVSLLSLGASSLSSHSSCGGVATVAILRNPSRNSCSPSVETRHLPLCTALNAHGCKCLRLVLASPTGSSVNDLITCGRE